VSLNLEESHQNVETPGAGPKPGGKAEAMPRAEITGPRNTSISSLALVPQRLAQPLELNAFPLFIRFDLRSSHGTYPSIQGSETFSTDVPRPLLLRNHIN
jgi:hypothetical protein